jgi:hypothetical protein
MGTTAIYVQAVGSDERVFAARMWATEQHVLLVQSPNRKQHSDAHLHTQHSASHVLPKRVLGIGGAG